MVRTAFFEDRMSFYSQRLGEGSPRWRTRAVLAVLSVALVASLMLIPGLGFASATGASGSAPTADAAALCVVRKQSPITGRVSIVYKTKVVKIKGKKKVVFLYRSVTKKI